MQRHSLDPVSLIAGGLFSAIALLLLTGHITAGSRHLNLVWAVAAVIVNVVRASRVSGSSSRSKQRTGTSTSTVVSRSAGAAHHRDVATTVARPQGQLLQEEGLARALATRHDDDAVRQRRVRTVEQDQLVAARGEADC